MLWRVFFSTAWAVFTISIMTSLEHATPIAMADTAILKFGVLDNQASSFLDLPASIIIGLFCGIIGTTFVWVNVTLGIYRKKYINKNWKKLAEAVFFAFLTSSVFFGAALLTSDKCIIINDAD
jgi:H+/Cl- antiporter ClcA